MPATLTEVIQMISAWRLPYRISAYQFIVLTIDPMSHFVIGRCGHSKRWFYYVETIEFEPIDEGAFLDEVADLHLAMRRWTGSRPGAPTRGTLRLISS